MPAGKLMKVVSAQPVSRTAKLERKVKNLSKKVYRSEPEGKYTNGIENAANSSYDGSLRTVFEPPAQGSSDTTRVGDSFRMKNLDLNFVMNAGATTCALRVIVFVDKKNFSTAVTDVLESGTIGVTRLLNAVNALYVHDYEDKYTILYDRTFVLSGTGDNIASFRKRFNLRGKICRQLAATTAITENAIKMIYISGSAAGATPQVQWQSRGNFVDA